MRTLIRTLLALALMAALATSCGDDTDDAADDSSSEATSTSVAGTEPNDGLEGDETGTAGDDGLTEADNACTTELTVQGTAEEAGVLDVQTAIVEDDGEGNVRLAFASFDYGAGFEGGPGATEDQPEVAEGEFLYVIDLQVDDPSAGLRSGIVFTTEGGESTAEEGTADRSTIGGTIAGQGLWQGPEQSQLSDTYVEILETKDGQVCGAIGADTSELMDSATVTGRFVAEIR